MIILIWRRLEQNYKHRMTFSMGMQLRICFFFKYASVHLTFDTNSPNEHCLVSDYLVNKCGHLVLFLPKFHSELNPIELFWAMAKKYYRDGNDMTAKNMTDRVERALDAVDHSEFYIRRCFRKCRDYMFAYFHRWISWSVFFLIIVLRSITSPNHLSCSSFAGLKMLLIMLMPWCWKCESNATKFFQKLVAMTFLVCAKLSGIWIIWRRKSL